MITKIENLTVAIPTVGRYELLSSCLDSISKNNSLPAEVIVADQSCDERLNNLYEKHASLPLRIISKKGIGVAKNRNVILQECSTDLLMIVDDDCVVDVNWIQRGSKALAETKQGLITGMVLPANGSKAVPSTKESKHPYNYTGSRAHGVLYPNNMAIYKDEAIALGGFDERDGLLSSEDLDFCYRWLCAGKTLKYDPEMIVTHMDWRSSKDLLALYKRYARGAGRFYGKHLAKKDFYVLRYIYSDIKRGLKAKLRRSAQTEATPNEESQLPFGVAVGVIEGFKEERSLKSTSNSVNK